MKWIQWRLNTCWILLFYILEMKRQWQIPTLMELSFSVGKNRCNKLRMFRNYIAQTFFLWIRLWKYYLQKLLGKVEQWWWGNWVLESDKLEFDSRLSLKSWDFCDAREIQLYHLPLHQSPGWILLIWLARWLSHSSLYNMCVPPKAVHSVEEDFLPWQERTDLWWRVYQ